MGPVEQAIEQAASPEEQVEDPKAAEIRRLFHCTAYSLADKDLRESVMDGISYIITACWLAGAAEMGRKVVTEIEVLHNLFGEGDRQKVISVMSVCIQPMMSHWFRKIEKQDKELARILAPRPELMTNPVTPEQEKKTIEGTLTFLLGRRRHKLIKDALDLETQHREDFPEEGDPRRWWYSMMLLSKLLEALGGKGFVNWKKTTFPVRDDADIAWVPSVDWPNFLTDAVKVSQAEDAGIAAFYQTRNEFRGA